MKIKNLIIFVTLLAVAISINAQQVETDAPSNAEAGVFFVGISGAFSLNTFSNSQISGNSEWSTVSGTGIIPSIDAYYMVSPNIGVGTGIKLGQYSPGITIDNFSGQLTTEFIDIDEEVYFPVYENVSLTEITTIKTIEIPLFVKYKLGMGKIDVHFDLGANFSVFRGASYTLDGTATRKGFYPELNVIIDGDTPIPEYNYYTNETLSPSSSIELSAPAMGLSAFFGVGASMEVFNGISIKLGLAGNYGLTKFGSDIPSTFNNFYSSTHLGGSNLHSFGVELGFFYKIF